MIVGPSMIHIRQHNQERLGVEIARMGCSTSECMDRIINFYFDHKEVPVENSRDSVPQLQQKVEQPKPDSSKEVRIDGNTDEEDNVLKVWAEE